MGTVCKVRSINLNYNTKQMVNFEVIRDMILVTGVEHTTTTVTVRTERKIMHKTKGEGNVSIITDPEDKVYRISLKRRRLDEHKSIPFGYK